MKGVLKSAVELWQGEGVPGKGTWVVSGRIDRHYLTKNICEGEMVAFSKTLFLFRK